jgi:hypothetical protein
VQEIVRRWFRSWVSDWRRGWFPLVILAALALPVPMLSVVFVLGVPWVLWLYWRNFQQFRNRRR